MQGLNDIAERLASHCPRLDVQVAGGGLVLRSEAGAATLRGPDQIGSFDAGERARRRQAGLSYLDLSSGTLFVDQAPLLIYVRLPPRAAAKLTAYQCALLSAVLESEAFEELERALAGPQVQAIRLMKLELGVQVQPMAMSRFLAALETRGILRRDSRRGAESKQTLDPEAALGALLDDFRLSSAGRARSYAGRPEVVEARLSECLAGRFALGVAEVLSRETGAWVEPRDYLVDGSADSPLEDLLGAPVPPGYAGKVVRVRPALRVPLGVLTLGGPTLQPLLALAEAARSESPIARQAGREAWERRREPR